ncbi:hypothetical protein PAXRUDRAFT_785935 [Paxillus rubicundulus Ve08.2h10]|uniref:Uncharacterized protein n=1 Tax=Paxillus rubicundulus Ve08.2h10 TaxID=930991 RepID=A0A0D0DPG1_9AGAM|nr:hypothetical protein PAXRUDRAFT_785935 [Paxillus rubicundulus Ve08.2h10]
MQQHSVKNPAVLAPPQTVQATPPSPSLPFSWANIVLITHKSGDQATNIFNEHKLSGCPNQSNFATYHRPSNHPFSTLNSLIFQMSSMV